MLPVVPVIAGMLAAITTCGKAAQTPPVRSPSGTEAVLKVISGDDYGKNTHLCLAQYKLLVMRGPGGDPQEVDLDASDGEWDRTLTVHLSGFSQDGKKLYGVLSEGGATPLAQLFSYDLAGGKVRIVDLRKESARIAGDHCQTLADVIGTTDAGAAVVMLASPTDCIRPSRWLLAADADRLQPLPPTASVNSLCVGTAR
jgi:hypothetical protein